MVAVTIFPVNGSGSGSGISSGTSSGMRYVSGPTSPNAMYDTMPAAAAMANMAPNDFVY